MSTSSNPLLSPAGKRVIVCADDFAVNQSVSMGIAKLARLGRISATSAMVLSPRWAQDAALLQDVRDQIDVGLHLDWTSDFAVAAGHGMSLPQAMRRAVWPGFEVHQARALISRQLDLFEQHWQRPPDHVDGHQHVQQFAGIGQALVSVLQERYGVLPVKPYLRISRAPWPLLSLKSQIIAWMGASSLEKIAEKAYLKRARGLFGIYDFKGDGARYATLMQHWLARAQTDTILMCHPAQAAEPGDEIAVARAQEFAYLGSAEFANALAMHRWRLVRGCEVTF